MNTPIDSAKTSLAIRSCRVCTYDLRGLPSGPCPECGTAFDRNQLQLYGERLGRSPVQYVWPLILVTLYWFVGSAAAAARLPIELRYVITAALLSAIGWLVWRRISNRQRFGTEGGRAQMIIGVEGVALRNGPGEADFTPWSRLRRFKVGRYWRFRVSWAKSRPSYHVLFGSAKYLDPLLPIGGPDAVLLDLLFECTAEEAAALTEAIEAFREKSDVSPTPDRVSGIPPGRDTT